MPCGTSSQRSSSPSETSPPLEPIGTRDIDSTPAATTTSRWPDDTAAAALNAAWSEEPHWRSTVEPATDSGHPATRAAIRAMFQPCSPTCETQPICTSSTSPGSSSLRSTSAVSTCPASASARSDARVPFRFPIGERTASTISASRIENSVQTPFARHPPELVDAAVAALDLRAGDEIPHGLRNQDLPGSRERSDSRTGRHGDPAQLAVHPLTLAGVEAGADLQTQCANALADRESALDCAPWPVESSEEAVSGGVQLLATEAGQLRSNDRVVTVEESAPARVAQLGGLVRRADDVREKDGGKDAVDPRRGREAFHESGCLVEQ